MAVGCTVHDRARSRGLAGSAGGQPANRYAQERSEGTSQGYSRARRTM